MCYAGCITLYKLNNIVPFSPGKMVMNQILENQEGQHFNCIQLGEKQVATLYDLKTSFRGGVGMQECLHCKNIHFISIFGVTLFFAVTFQARNKNKNT